MVKYKFTNFTENSTPALTCIKWHFVLPAVGTLVLKHDGDAPITFGIIN